MKRSSKDLRVLALRSPPAMPKDALLADLLPMGIVSIGISKCPSTPKALTDPEGSVGAPRLVPLVFLDKFPL